MKSLKKTLVLLVVLSMILSAVSPVFAFNDVISEDYAEQANKMGAFGVFAGDAEGNFKAEENITRAEMAVIIGKLMGLTANEADANKGYASNFSDVAAGDWYTGWVNLVAGRGIISGFPDGTFRPNEKVTQAQAVTMIVKALGWGVVVDQTGTWPANYITKASELRLFKNAVETNSELVTRGNVAIYCYNALEAKTWDVTESTDGKLTSSSRETTTILAKYFSDFVNEAGDMKLVEDAKVTVSGALTSAIGENQVKIEAAGISAFIDAENAPRKDKELATYKASADAVIAYVPAEVANIATVSNKTVDVIFGRDNEVAYLVVTDDAVDAAYVTAYNAGKAEIEIDGVVYDIADDVKVRVFGYEYALKANVNVTTGVDAETGLTKITTILSALGANDTKNVTRNVIAETTLNADDEIETINFKFSQAYSKDIVSDLVANYDVDGKFENYTVNQKTLAVSEYIVEKISSKNVVTAAGRTTKLDLEDVEDKDDPRVIRNGEIATVYDIEVGDVVTEVSYDGDIVALIVVANTVEGEITDYVAKTNAFEIDGTDYKAIANPFYNVDGEIDEYLSQAANALMNDFEDETVTVYLNMAGEVVAVVGESEATGAILGIVTDYAEIDEDSNEVEYIKVRILAENGTDKIYKIYNKRSGKDIQEAAEYGALFTEASFYPAHADTATETVLDEAKALVTAKAKALADAIKADPTDPATDERNALKAAQATLAGYLATGTVVKFAADSDRVIKSDDITVVAASQSATDLYDFKSQADVYVMNAITPTGTTLVANVDSKKLTYDNDDYRFTSSTVVLNPATKETISWDVLTKETKDVADDSDLTTISGNVWLFVKDSKVVYMIASIAELNYGASDLQYGILVDVDRTKDEDENTIYVATVLVDGEEKTFECESDVRNLEYGSFISFKVSSGELVEVALEAVTDLVDVIADSKNDTDYIAYKNTGTEQSPTWTMETAVTNNATLLANLKKLQLVAADTYSKKYEEIKVKSVEVLDGDTFVIFEAAGSKTIDLADDYVVYSLDDGEMLEEVSEGDYILTFSQNKDGEYEIVVVL